MLMPVAVDCEFWQEEGYCLALRFTTPRSMPPAAAAAAADEREFRQDAEEDRRLKRQRHKLARRLPLYDVMSELRMAAQRMHPNFAYMGVTRPVVAVRLDLECPDPVERKRHGVATIKVRQGLKLT
jgi:hypothetical protein